MMINQAISIPSEDAKPEVIEALTSDSENIIPTLYSRVKSGFGRSAQGTLAWYPIGNKFEALAEEKKLEKLLKEPTEKEEIESLKEKAPDNSSDRDEVKEEKVPIREKEIGEVISEPLTAGDTLQGKPPKKKPKLY